MKTYEQALDSTKFGFQIENIGRTFQLRVGESLHGVATVGKGKAIWKWYSNTWHGNDGDLKKFTAWCKRNKVTCHKS